MPVHHVLGQPRARMPSLRTSSLKQFAQAAPGASASCAAANPPNIVVRLDHMRLAGSCLPDSITSRINRALSEPLHVPRASPLPPSKTSTEHAPDDLALSSPGPPRRRERPKNRCSASTRINPHAPLLLRETVGHHLIAPRRGRRKGPVDPRTRQVSCAPIGAV